MTPSITVGVIGATGKTGQSVVNGLLTSQTNSAPVTPNKREQLLILIPAGCYILTQATSVGNEINQQLKAKGVRIAGYDLEDPRNALVDQLKTIDVLISCIAWEHLDQQISWIEAAKEAGVKRFVPAEWVGHFAKGCHRH